MIWCELRLSCYEVAPAAEGSNSTDKPRINIVIASSSHLIHHAQPLPRASSSSVLQNFLQIAVVSVGPAVARIWVRNGLPPIRDPGVWQVWVVDLLVKLSTRTARLSKRHAIIAVSRGDVGKLQLRAHVPERYADAAVVILPMAARRDLLAMLNL